MNQSDIEFFRSLKQVGLVRAKELFGYVEAYEGLANTKPSKLRHITKSQLRLIENVGDEIQAKFPSKRGRKPGQVNPNSKLQRVSKAVAEFLQGKKMGASCKDIIAHVVEATELPESDVRASAYFVKGIQREYGTWKLESLFKKAAA